MKAERKTINVTIEPEDLTTPHTKADYFKVGEKYIYIINLVDTSTDILYIFKFVRYSNKFDGLVVDRKIAKIIDYFSYTECQLESERAEYTIIYEINTRYEISNNHIYNLQCKLNNIFNCGFDVYTKGLFKKKYRNDYEMIRNEINKSFIFEEFKQLKLTKKDNLEKKHIDKIKSKLNKYLVKHNEFLHQRNIFEKKIREIEADIDDNLYELKVGDITPEECDNLNKECVDDIMKLEKKYEINQRKYKYTITLIKYLTGCVKFNIEIDETIEKCIKSVGDFNELYKKLFDVTIC